MTEDTNPKGLPFYCRRCGKLGRRRYPLTGIYCDTCHALAVGRLSEALRQPDSAFSEPDIVTEDDGDPN